MRVNLKQYQAKVYILLVLLGSLQLKPKLLVFSFGNHFIEALMGLLSKRSLFNWVYWTSGLFLCTKCCIIYPKIVHGLIVFMYCPFFDCIARK